MVLEKKKVYLFINFSLEVTVDRFIWNLIAGYELLRIFKLTDNDRLGLDYVCQRTLLCSQILNKLNIGIVKRNIFQLSFENKFGIDK